MKKLYLLSIYQPDGDPPPPDVLARVMSDIDVMNQELKAGGNWVFAGGLHPASTHRPTGRALRQPSLRAMCLGKACAHARGPARARA
jgi:hypothetical protein